MVLHFKESWIVFELLGRFYRHVELTLDLLLQPCIVHIGHLVAEDTHQ